MTKPNHTSDDRSAELYRFAVERAGVLADPRAERASTRWAYEAAALGEVSALGALALLRD